MQAQRDLGIGMAKQCQPGQQQLARKGRRDRDSQPYSAGIVRWSGNLLQRRKRLAHSHQVGDAIHAEAEVVAGEKLQCEVRLKLADAMTDCAGRDAELFRRQCHTAQTRHRLEGQQALDGRDTWRSHGGRIWPKQYCLGGC